MADRETILAALHTAIQATVPGMGETLHFERNRNSEIEEEKCPAVILWDGDETEIGNRAIGRSPLVNMEMHPEIWGFVTVAKSSSGTTINSLLRRVQRAIYSNATFKSAVGEFTTVSMSSITTGLGRGKKASADFGIQLSIQYQFNPAAS